MKTAAIILAGVPLLLGAGPAHPAGGATSANEAKIVFERDNLRCCSSLVFEIWTMNSNGSRQRRILRNGDVPVWSPDRSSVAFTRGSFSPSPPSQELWLARSDGSSPRQVTDVYPRQVTGATWSPDGTQLAYFDARGLWTISPDGSHLSHLLGERRAGPNEPAWSPDGRYIAFLGYKVDGLYLINVATHAVRRIGHFSGNCGWHSSPSWSPDSKRLAFCRPPSNRRGKERIFIVRTGGKGLRLLTPGVGPAWSPDGKWIAYQGEASKAGYSTTYPTLYKIRVNGGGRKRLTHYSSCFNGTCSGDSAANW